MTSQSAKAVGLVIPGFFGFNSETSRTNVFQRAAAHSQMIHEEALKEIKHAYDIYKNANINVHVFKSHDLTLPDAIFPNSVITFAGADLPFGDPSKHYAILCPMLEESRQRERSPYADFLKNELGYELVTENIFENPLSVYEAQPLTNRQALEGTGSLALDRINKIAYCALSPRSDAELAAQLCKAIGYRLVSFKTYNDIYHTDLVMFIGTGYACLCPAIIRRKDRKRILKILRQSGLDIYKLGKKSFRNFCLNSREVEDADGNKCIFMSSNAYAFFGRKPLAALARRDIRILHAAIPTIETYGGGSGCCITQELHGLK